jgi:hypothetical protein
MDDKRGYARGWRRGGRRLLFIGDALVVPTVAFLYSVSISPSGGFHDMNRTLRPFNAALASNASCTAYTAGIACPIAFAVSGAAVGAVMSVTSRHTSHGLVCAAPVGAAGGAVGQNCYRWQPRSPMR